MYFLSSFWVPLFSDHLIHFMGPGCGFYMTDITASSCSPTFLAGSALLISPQLHSRRNLSTPHPSFIQQASFRQVRARFGPFQASGLIKILCTCDMIHGGSVMRCIVGGGRMIHRRQQSSQSSDCLYRFTIKNAGKMELGKQKTGRCLTYRGSYTEMFGLVLKTCRKRPSKPMGCLYYSTLALWPDLWTCISLSLSFSLLSRSFSLCHIHPDLNKHSRTRTHTLILTLPASRVCEVGASALSC